MATEHTSLEPARPAVTTPVGEPPAATVLKLPDPSLVTTTHAIYALHALSILIGLTSAATVIGAFVFGLPSILAVILNYARRLEVRGTVLESHFRWQIRTFWFAFVWVLSGLVLFFTLIGIPLAFAVWFGVTLWVIYRVVRGWMRLQRLEPMYA
jgi:uncharacterized membrane protein